VGDRGRLESGWGRVEGGGSAARSTTAAFLGAAGVAGIVD
jgi:hypothetical protein